jgi:hypothetical protein
MITPSSLMLVGRFVTAWQNGGSNKVIVPSRDRTKSDGAVSRKPVIAPSSLILDGNVSPEELSKWGKMGGRPKGSGEKPTKKGGK